MAGESSRRTVEWLLSPAASRIRMFLRPVLAVLLAAAPLLAFAQEAVKPVPTPDLSRLPAAAAAELRKARADFDRSQDAVTGDALAENYGLLGGAYARAGLTDAAAVALENAVVVAPRLARWSYARGVLALAAGHSAEATQWFERAWAANQDYLPLRTALANQKIGAGDLDGARRLLEDYTRKHHGEAVPHAMLGDIAMRQKRPADAVAAYRRALELQPQADRLQGQLAEALAANGDARGAAEARSRAGTRAPQLADPIGSRMLPAEAAPANADPQQQVIAKAVAAAAQGEHAAARAALDAWLASHPQDATVLAIYARLEIAAGRLDAARSRANAAANADPKNPLARLALGLVAELGGDAASAERAYGDTIRLDATATEPRFALGSLLQRQGRADAAMEQYRAVLAGDAGNPAAWARVAALEAAAGRCRQVLAEINGALAREPQQPQLMQVFVRLASTCAGASAAERQMALDYSGRLYAQRGANPEVAEAHALALAANGKWEDAVATQQAAMFALLRVAGSAALPPYREFLQAFEAKRLPARPWPDSAEVYRPAAPTLGNAG